METEAHARLKTLAMLFLRSVGFQAVAAEVMCPINRHRLDVAGYIDALPTTDGVTIEPASWAATTLFERPPERRPIEPRTAIIECKQDRADFLRERHDLARLLTRRDRLHEMRENFESSHLKNREPELRQSGVYLFEEMERWSFGAARSPQYRGLLRRIDRADASIHKGAKLSRMVRYRLADRFYMMAPPGVIAPRELPNGWGLLEAPTASLVGRSLDPALVGHVRVARPASVCRSNAKLRGRMLRNIAIASTRAACPLPQTTQV
jgi:hypothetical protein